jgi:hypothetical protein
MASSKLTVGWIRLKSTSALLAPSSLEDNCPEPRFEASPEINADIQYSKIGFHDLVVISPTEPQTADAFWTPVQRIAGHFPDIQYFVITGTLKTQKNDSSLGDIILCPSFNEQTTSNHKVLQRAIDVLQGEVGVDGSWLSAASDDVQSDRNWRRPSWEHGGTQDAHHSPQLHYYRNLDAMRANGDVEFSSEGK